MFISTSAASLQNSIAATFSPNKLQELARKSGFLLRQFKFKPEEFLDTLMFSDSDHSQLSLQDCCNDLLQQRQKHQGNCWDAVAESFFKTLKTEWVYHKKYLTVQQAALSIFQYIESWYNTRRRHSSLGYKSTKHYEEYLNTKLLVA